MVESKRFGERDLKPIALTGQYAGEPIEADKPGLTHKHCRDWKLYCPECYQFVHLRKSDKIKSYFAHYDVEDKRCTYRVEPSTNYAEVDRNNTASKKQDLKGIQEDLKAVFSNIDSCFEGKVKKINDIQYLRNISRDIISIYFSDHSEKNNFKEEWKELEDWIRNNSSNHPDHCIAVLNILSIDMNRHILEKLIQYAIYHVTFESFELVYSRAKESSIKAQIQSNKEDFFNKTIEKILQIIIDIDWKTKQFKTNSKEKKYQPFISRLNIRSDNKLLFINKDKHCSIISCEGLVYSVINNTDKNSELFKLQLNYEKGVDTGFLGLTSPSQDFFSELIWKIINSSNVQWFMLAVGILASQKIQGDILTKSLIGPIKPLPLSDKKWIDATNQVIRDIEEEIEKIPVSSGQTALDGLQDMLSVAEQELQDLGINSASLRDVLRDKFKK